MGFQDTLIGIAVGGVLVWAYRDGWFDMILQYIPGIPTDMAGDH